MPAELLYLERLLISTLFLRPAASGVSDADRLAVVILWDLPAAKKRGAGREPIEAGI